MSFLSLRLPLLMALFLAALSASASAQGTGATTAPIMPDPKLTPGDVLDVTLSDIQEHGYSAKVRNVPIAVQLEVYASYGITHWVTGEYEADHLIPLAARTRAFAERFRLAEKGQTMEYGR